MSISHFNHKTACPCGLEFVTTNHGVTVVEMASFGPYKIWMADLRTCADGHQVLAGFGDHPLGEHFHPEFAKMLQAAEMIADLGGKPIFRIYETRVARDLALATKQAT